MNALERDKAALTQLDPSGIETYLQEAGWSEMRATPAASYWRKRPDGSDNDAFLMVPRNPAFSDHAARMSEFVRGLADFERRAPADIMQTLLAQDTALTDRFEARIDRTDSTDGTIPLLLGARAFKSAKDIFAYAAASELHARAVHPSAIPPDAKKALRFARLGQTKHGSYVITVVSRLPPVQEKLLDISGQPSTEPIERRVLTRVATALHAVRRAAERDAMSAYEDGVPEGVSANICAAVARLAESKKVRGVQFSLTWAKSHPAPPNVPRQITFSPRLMLSVRQGAAHLKRVEPTPDFIVTGKVVALRKAGEAEGAVTVRGYVDSKEREVTMNLLAPDHQLAHRAYNTNETVTALGDLLVRGDSYKLLIVRRFDIVRALVPEQ